MIFIGEVKHLNQLILVRRQKKTLSTHRFFLFKNTNNKDLLVLTLLTLLSLFIAAGQDF